ncbi:GNAT family N-acetyltransferase [Sphingobacterium sp. JB170]|uniref:GNAT family N-acetyltransferase n=1 Tax=Sphingobacterium sp. JB170 TaxID=1434842 RepID=UPI00097EBC86|nr:GNAT family N-acetyltransferase [Sphingobacterium sp. JB170]SJN49910.1 Acetyltransferase [Sphingobacterium sp. JB170]
MKTSSIIIRPERNDDHAKISRLINLAFGRLDEAELVDRLRNSHAFIPSLSLVAVQENEIVGQILFTHIKIVNGKQETSALGLAPLSVLPVFQNQGVGKRLVQEGLQKAAASGHKLVFVLGHELYYPKFGFLPADKWHIKFPIDVPYQNFMALALAPEALQNISGMVQYAPEFNILSPKVTTGITIETERLILKPLTYDQLVKYVQCDNSLESDLNLNKSSRMISADLKAAFEETIFPNVADKTKNYLFCTIWTAISKTENIMVGDICMYGEPNEKGEVEIGYGVYDEYQNKGFMSEVVAAMIKWITKRPNIKSAIASTEKGNIPSYKVLEKNGFIKIGETDSLLHWRLSTDC